MRIVITEEQFNVISENIDKPIRDMFEGFNEEELTEEYPVNFDLNQFKNIPSYAGKLRYAQEHLGKPIGNGSSRVVYRVDETKVLKLAKNKRGIAQNEAECDAGYNNYYYDDIIAKVFDFDDKDYIWSEMEIAFKTKKSDFKRLWNIDYEYLPLYLYNRYCEEHGKKIVYGFNDDVQSSFDESDEVGSLVSFMFEYDTPSGDLGKLNSYGIVKRDGEEQLVLIDFGLTNNVYSTYYS